MALQAVFTAAQLTAIAADQGATSTIPSAGQQGFHITNQSGAFVSVTDNFGSTIARIGPWLDMTGHIQLATTQLTFSVNKSDPVQQIAGVGSVTWSVLYELLIEPQPIVTTMLASALAGPIVPANSPITSILSAGTITPAFYALGTPFTRPSKLFQVSMCLYDGALLTSGSSSDEIVIFGLNGVTSGITVILGLDAIALYNNTTITTFIAGSARINLVYPYPLDIAGMFPTDAQLQFITNIPPASSNGFGSLLAA